MLKRLKYAAAEVVKRHPIAWAWSWKMLPRLPFLLPHDKSYYGFKQLTRNEGGLFLDIGANNGISAAGFHKLNPHYGIVSIEANRHHEPALEHLKRKLTNFEYTLTGVGTEPAEFVLITPVYRGIPIHTHSSTSREYIQASLNRDFAPRIVESITYHDQTIAVVRVDSLGLEPDIVKIDVEGHDYAVLLGMTETISRCRPAVMIEFTPHNTGPFADFFARYTYDLFVYDVENDRFVAFDDERESRTWQNSGLQVNVFAIPAERRAAIRLG
jgi:FkbM family methyltransferase